MSEEVVARVLASARYRDVDRVLLARLAAEELPRARSVDEAVKRVKRRLHQAVGAYRGGRARSVAGEVGHAWSGRRWDEPMLAACRRVLARHASTRERSAELDRFYPAVWEALGGAPSSVLDLACGLGPFALPFMGLDPAAEYLACDADRRVLDEVEELLTLVGQPHRTWPCDLVGDSVDAEADVALLLKTLPLLDRQDRGAAVRLMASLRVGHAVVSFPLRSLAGRGGLEPSYRRRMDDVVNELGPRVATSSELRFGTELVFVLGMSGHRG